MQIYSTNEELIICIDDVGVFTKNLCIFFTAVWLRENLGLPALAIVFYMELAEEEQAQQLQLLIQNLNIATITTKPLQILSSNLYIWLYLYTAV